LADINHISCGSHHTAFLNKSGRAYISGNGRKGQLGSKMLEVSHTPKLLEFSESIKDISCGIEHTLILDSKHNVYSFGGNAFGQLGIGNKQNMDHPTQIKELINIAKISAGHHSAAIDKNGILYIWGTGFFGFYLTPHQISLDKDCIDVSIGGCFGVAIDGEGKLLSWGSNSSGELGVSNSLPSKTPTQVNINKCYMIESVFCGSSHAVAIVHENYTPILESDEVQNYSQMELPVNTHQSLTSKNSRVKSAKMSPRESENGTTQLQVLL
jgi:alpha-tubulin suppressor-like RCC1 family protein